MTILEKTLQGSGLTFDIQAAFNWMQPSSSMYCIYDKLIYLGRIKFDTLIATSYCMFS